MINIQNTQRTKMMKQENKWPNFKKWATDLKQKLLIFLYKCSVSLAMREMKIKTILRFYFIPVRIVLRSTTANSYLWGCGEKRSLMYSWWDCKLVHLLRKLEGVIHSWKLRVDLTYDPTMSLHDTCPRTQHSTPQTLAQLCSLLF